MKNKINKVYQKLKNDFYTKKFLHYYFSIILFLLLSIFFTWPLVTELESSVISDRGGDPYFVFWVVSGMLDKIVSLDFVNFWDSQMFYPYPNTYLFSDHSLGMAIQLLPLAPWRENYVLLENATLIMSFWFSGVGGYILGLHYFKRKNLALLCAIMIAFNPYHFAISGHMQIFVYHFLPFTVVFFEKLIKTPTLRNAVLFSIFFVWNASMSIYLLSASVFILIIIGLGRLLFKQITWSRKSIIIYILSFFACILFVFILYKDYLHISELHNVSRTPEESAIFSARPIFYLVAQDNHLIVGDLSVKIKSMFDLSWSERTLYFGLSIILLSSLNLLNIFKFSKNKFNELSEKTSNKLIFLLVFLFAIAFAFGPYYVFKGNEIKLPFGYLFDWLFFLRGTRAPTRIHVISVLAIAVLATYGFIKLRELLSKRSRILKIVSLLILLFIFFDIFYVPINLTKHNKPNIEEYEWTEKEGMNGSVLFHFPTYAFTPLIVHLNHIDQKNINGYSGIFPDSIRLLMAETNNQNFAEVPINQLTAAANMGATHFVFHKNWTIVGIDNKDQTTFRDKLNNSLSNLTEINKIEDNEFISVFNIENLKDYEFKNGKFISSFSLSEKNVDFFIKPTDKMYVSEEITQIEIDIRYSNNEIQKYRVYKPLYIPYPNGYKFRFDYRDLKQEPKNIVEIDFKDIY